MSVMNREARLEDLKAAIFDVYPKDHTAELIAELALVLEVDSVPVPGNVMESSFFFNEILRKTKENKRAAGRFWKARAVLEDFLKR